MEKEKIIKTKKENLFSLFEGRHKLPENSGALFSDFDFEEFIPIHNDKVMNRFVEKLGNNEEVGVIVTGLTPALCYLIEMVIMLKKEMGGSGKLICYHFDKDSLSYKIRGEF